MKWLLALLTIGPLSLVISACGGSTDLARPTAQPSAQTATQATTPTNTTTPLDFRKADSDRDNDVGTPGDDTNNDSVLNYAHAASTADKQAIASLIKRYYAAAVAENGAKACALLYSTFAEGVPEVYGQSPPGPPYMRGTTCPTVMTLYFKHFHRQLVAQAPVLQVSRVRLQEHHGFAVLTFGKMPERRIPVAREGRVWRVEALLDSPLP